MRSLRMWTVLVLLSLLTLTPACAWICPERTRTVVIVTGPMKPLPLTSSDCGPMNPPGAKCWGVSEAWVRDHAKKVANMKLALDKAESRVRQLESR